MDQQDNNPAAPDNEFANSSSPDFARLTPELLSAVMGELGVLPDKDRATLEAALKTVGSNYLLEKWAQRYDAHSKAQKEAMDGLIEKLNAALIAIAEIAPEYWATIQGMAVPRGSTSVTADTFEEISRLRDATQLFLDRYKAPRGPRGNVELEHAVRDMRFHFTELGIAVTVDMNKHGVGGTKSNSAGATAMVRLLRALEPKVPESTILNMIDTIRTKPHAKPDHSSAIWNADPDLDLDLSLHQRRRDR